LNLYVNLCPVLKHGAYIKFREFSAGDFCRKFLIFDDFKGDDSLSARAPQNGVKKGDELWLVTFFTEALEESKVIEM
jgi:hypothetical protein